MQHPILIICAVLLFHIGLCQGQETLNREQIIELAKVELEEVELYANDYLPKYRYAADHLEEFGLSDSLEVSFEIYSMLASIYENSGAFQKSIESAQECLRIAHEANDSAMFLTAYSDIGFAEAQMGNSESALKNIFSAISYSTRKDYTGKLYLDQSKIDPNVINRKKYLDTAFILIEGSEVEYLKLYALNALSEYQHQIEDWNGLIKSSQKILSTPNIEDYPDDYTFANINLVEAYLQKGNIGPLENILLRTLDYSRDKDVMQAQMETTRLLSNYYQEIKNYKKGLNYSYQYHELKDSIYSIESMESYNQLRTVYEIEKEELKTANLAIEKELLQQELNSERSRQAILLLIAGAAILTLLLGMIYYRLKRRNSQLEQLKLKTERDQLSIQKEKIENELHLKRKKLSEIVLQKHEKNELIKTLIDEVEQSQKTEKSSMLQKLTSKLNHMIESDDDWAIFQKHFSEVHNQFFEKLKSQFPKLTPKDLKFCAYARMNLSNKEMASMMACSPRTVEGIRYRVRKKLNLDSSQNIIEFLTTF